VNGFKKYAGIRVNMKLCGPSFTGFAMPLRLAEKQHQEKPKVSACAPHPKHCRSSGQFLVKMMHLQGPI